LTPRPFKNPSPEYLARKATAQKRTKTVKVLLLAERDKELAEIARINKKRKEKQTEDASDMQTDEAGGNPSTSGGESDMDIDDEASDGAGKKKVLQVKEMGPKEGNAPEDDDVLICCQSVMSCQFSISAEPLERLTRFIYRGSPVSYTSKKVL
jgi:hypothetical protein